MEVCSTGVGSKEHLVNRRAPNVRIFRLVQMLPVVVPLCLAAVRAEAGLPVLHWDRQLQALPIVADAAVVR